MKTLLLIGQCILLPASLLYSQYLETFSLDNKGILAGPCTGSGGNTCSSFDFTGVDWFISGNLGGVLNEGFSTSGGDLIFSNLDNEVCWKSPNIDISGVSTASFNVAFSIPSGSSWESSQTSGSVDYLDVKYAVDGGSFTTLSNVSGCPASGHTVSGSSCSSLVGPLNYSIGQSGITGSSLSIQICADVNALGDIGHIESVEVPEAGVVLPVIWKSISAQQIDLGIEVSWSTYSEINNNYYEVEVALDEAFESIGLIDLVSDTSNGNYTFMDYNSYNARYVVYRIKQVDLDGTISYSPLTQLELNPYKDAVFKAYPNPTEGMIQFKGGYGNEDLVTMKIYNGQGMLVSKESLYWSGSIDLSRLSPGIYHIVLVGGVNDERHQTAIISKI